MSLARCLALALGGCACLASTAAAAQTVRLKVAFDPDRAGVRTTIKLALRIGGPGHAPPVPVTSLALRLPPDMGIATTTLGESNCDPAALIARGLHGCSANARMGLGEATAVVPVGSHNVQEKASLNVLMGPALQNRLEVLFYVEAREPVFAQLVFPSVFAEDRPPFGEQLDTAIPLVQAWPSGPNLALETFDSTIGPLHLTYRRQVNGKTISFHPHGVRVPRACPAGGYPFGALLGFQDGTSATARYHVACPPR
ncbi:MAG: hypothetical protein WA484_12600 [Solirubrobacteraceae bacterium]